MKERLSIPHHAPEAFRAMLQLEGAVQGMGLERSLYELVKIRASQINGCAYCIDMHTKDARAHGETEQRIYALSAWRPSGSSRGRSRRSSWRGPPSTRGTGSPSRPGPRRAPTSRRKPERTDRDALRARSSAAAAAVGARGDASGVFAELVERHQRGRQRLVGLLAGRPRGPKDRQSW